MKGQKNCMPVRDYFIPAIELKPVENSTYARVNSTV